MSSTSLDYDAIADALANVQSDFHPPQIHGLFCGFLCGATEKEATKWMKELLGKHTNTVAQKQFTHLYRHSTQQLETFSLEFSLLLPDDEMDINHRTEALGLWCQGFLAGLKTAGVVIEKREPGEVTDALKDIIEIAQVSYGDMTDNEEDETAYSELVEYIRMAVLLIFQELKNGQTMQRPLKEQQ